MWRVWESWRARWVSPGQGVAPAAARAPVRREGPRPPTHHGARGRLPPPSGKLSLVYYSIHEEASAAPPPLPNRYSIVAESFPSAWGRPRARRHWRIGYRTSGGSVRTTRRRQVPWDHQQSSPLDRADSIRQDRNAFPWSQTLFSTGPLPRVGRRAVR